MEEDGQRTRFKTQLLCRLSLGGYAYLGQDSRPNQVVKIQVARDTPVLTGTAMVSGSGFKLSYTNTTEETEGNFGRNRTHSSKLRPGNGARKEDFDVGFWSAWLGAKQVAGRGNLGMS